MNPPPTASPVFASRWAPIGHRGRRWLSVVAVAVAFTAAALGGEAPDGGWSAALLQQILKEPPAKPASAAAPAPALATVAAPAADHPAGAVAPASALPSSSAPVEAAEFALHTYRLLHLRVGQAGKPQNVLAILQKLLPPGSSLNVDVPENSVHVLTTAAAHQAVWDYLSAVDSADVGPVAAREIPGDVKAALEKLAASSEEAARVARSVTQMQATVDRGLAAIGERQHRQAQLLLLGFGAFAVAGVVTLGWTMRRRPARRAVEATASTALALAPEQLATVLTPVHDRMRTDMLGLLNEVAIKLQAQHQEQQLLVQEQQRQLETARQVLADERRQFIAETGSLVVQAVERVDATAVKLAKQQDKVAELVQELQDTVRELDSTKDNLRDREIQLEQERAKIAALSLLLEEGAPLPSFPADGHAPNGSRSSSPCDSDAIPPSDRFERCTTLAPRATPPDRRTSVLRPQTFIFLPPDQPES